MKLWSPFHKKLCIAGIKMQSGVIRHSTQVLETLARHWGPIFEDQPFDVEVADSFLDKYVPAFDFKEMPPPSSSNIAKFLRNARRSGPGVDGLPYAAWRHAGESGSPFLFEVSLLLRSGRTMGMDFFAAKGDEELDHTEVLRSPGDTRPLGLKNTDNKTIGACVNRTMKTPIRDGANRLQNGFNYQRNFLNNIVQLDTAARI